MALPEYSVYPSDLNDAGWVLLAPLIPRRTGRPPAVGRRATYRRGLFYVLRTGCAWRYLPPRTAIIASPPVKTLMGAMRGFDGHQQVAGGKRHILVDTEEHLLAVADHPANLPDRAGGRLVLDAVGESFPLDTERELNTS